MGLDESGSTDSLDRICGIELIDIPPIDFQARVVPSEEGCEKIADPDPERFELKKAGQVSAAQDDPDAKTEQNWNEIKKDLWIQEGGYDVENGVKEWWQ